MIKNTIIYIVFSALGRSGAFLLLPLLTSTLTKSDFGWLALFSNAMIFLTPIISLNGNILIAKKVDHLKKESVLESLQANTILMVLITTICILPILFYSIDYFKLLFLTVFASLFGSINSFYLMKIQLEQNPTKYGITQIVAMCGNVLLTLIFLYFDYLSYETRVIAILVGLYLPFYKEINAAIITFRFKIIKKEYIKYGTKLIPLSFLTWMLLHSDKLIVGELFSLDVIGGYFVIYSLCLPLDLLLVGFGRVIQPLVFKNINDFKKQVGYFIIFVGFAMVCFFCYGLVAPYLGKLFIDIKFHDDMIYMIPIALYMTLSHISSMIQGVQISQGNEYLVTKFNILSVLVFLGYIYTFGSISPMQVSYGVSLGYVINISANLLYLLWFRKFRNTENVW